MIQKLRLWHYGLDLRPHPVLYIACTALAGWLANIKKMSSNKLLINKPLIPNTDPLQNMPDEWKMLLIQFILHKRMNRNSISKVTGWTKEKVEEILVAMKRSGLLEEKVTPSDERFATAEPGGRPWRKNMISSSTAS